MAIRKGANHNNRKSKRSKVKHSRSSKSQTSETEQVVITFLDQLRSIDPMYVGTLGIRITSAGEDKKTNSVNMNFNASNVIIAGKQYRNKNWFVVNYNYGSDTYSLQGMHMKRNYDIIKTPLFTNMDAYQVYKKIHKLSQQ